MNGIGEASSAFRAMLTKSPNKLSFPSIKLSFSMLDFWTYVFGAISFIFYTLIRVKAK